MTAIKMKTVKLISRLLMPMAEEGLFTYPEYKEVIANLKQLAQKGELIPTVVPKLIDQKETANMLGISYGNFKKLEKEEAFTFNRRMVGSAVRYRNTDIIKYILGQEESTEAPK